MIDMTGQKIGRLRVICREGRSSEGQATWRCLCECGSTTVVPSKALRTSHTRSCGCLVVDLRRSTRGESHPSFLGERITYSAAHQRTRRERGKAESHPCADCGEVAADWSLRSDSSVRLVGSHGKVTDLAFSPHTSDYEPRCRPCHRQHDKEVALCR